MADALESPSEGSEDAESAAAVTPASEKTVPDTKSLWKTMFGKQKKTDDAVADGEEKLTTRQRLAKLGLAAVLSYGWVSNMSYCICVSIAWYGFSKQVG